MFAFHPGVHAPLEKHPKKKRYVYPPVPVNPSLVQAWRIAYTGTNEPPLLGHIRLLAPFTGHECLRIPLFCQDRTITEWNTLLTSYESWTGCVQKEWLVGVRYNPFIHWRTMGILLRTEYQRQMKLRWLVRKWVQRMKYSLYKKRLIGETDLHTLEPIIPKDAVQIVCWRTKSVYQFHVHSILRMIRENLFFEQWGRSDPLAPRNPYTNQPWSYGQLMHLVQTIQQKMVERGRVIPSFITQFVEANYCIEQFYTSHKLELGVNATTRFFQSSDSIGVRRELLEQLFEQIDKRPNSIYDSIEQKRCTGSIQSYWEELIQNKWIHDNYGYSPKYGWRDTYEQTRTILRVYVHTVEWWDSVQCARSIGSHPRRPITLHTTLNNMLEELEEPLSPEQNDDAASIS
jgi:hypothetical protein